ncbi:diacylglycerol kinase family protein [Sulfitobacter sp. D35]|uniref:diacylglycerol/lipid kinase family protein n=1 Tax=Sulfitobacter sp. D35 TaxID=3083252 RepID=UPI00296FF73B|nr:diacylglycerol kinase family protein [Sulfitobacter sp. D35]MDW4497223.1 diacylglycerol kinase family protein [Sulfitobacter sp. D35]
MINPKSGRRRGEANLDDIGRLFEANGMDVTFSRLTKGSDVEAAAREAVAAGYDCVVSAGGDGTMSGVASALKNTGVAMGILPLGTFNYFARSLGVPEDLEGAVANIARGIRRRIAVGTINDRVFLNNASLGIYPEVLRTRETTYTRWGRSRIAAYWSVLLTLLRFPKPLRLKITAGSDAFTVRTPLAFVVSNAFQLEQLGLEGADCIRNGQMALLLAPDCKRSGLFLRGLALALGVAQKNRDFRLVCVDPMEIASTRKRLLIARDGERAGMERPFRFQLHSDALTVIAPAETASKVR